MPLNADLRQRVAIDTGRLDWHDDVATGVRLKPLACTAHDPVQRTDIIEYPAGARIDNATLGGAEILVLAGLLEDEFGDEYANQLANYPPGSYLKLPSGESAKLATTTGCTLFIKRGHPATLDVRERVVLRPQERAWHPGLVPGLRVLSLGEFEGAHTALVEWAPGTRFQYQVWRLPRRHLAALAAHERTCPVQRTGLPDFRQGRALADGIRVTHMMVGGRLRRRS